MMRIDPSQDVFDSTSTVRGSSSSEHAASSTMVAKAATERNIVETDLGLGSEPRNALCECRMYSVRARLWKAADNWNRTPRNRSGGDSYYKLVDDSGAAS